eukprot:COSAG01_NODE_646_length_14556_cov_9.736806_6_plen_70_part_00
MCATCNTCVELHGEALKHAERGSMHARLSFSSALSLCWGLSVCRLLFHSHSQTQKQRLLVEFTKLILFY